VAAPDMSNSASLSSLRRGISLERHTTCHTERNHSVKASHGDSKKVLSHSSKKKKSASESDLLSAGGMNNNQSRNGYGIPTTAYQDDPDFPAPPKPEDLLLMSASETLETVTGTEGQEGFYRSFDDIDTRLIHPTVAGCRTLTEKHRIRQWLHPQDIQTGSVPIQATALVTPGHK